MNTSMILWCVGMFVFGMYSWRIASYMVHIIFYINASKAKRGGRIKFDDFRKLFPPTNFIRLKQFRNSLFVNPAMISDTMDLDLYGKYEFHAGSIKVNDINRWMSPIDYFRVYKILKEFKVMTREEFDDEYTYHSTLVSFPHLTREEFNLLKSEMKG